MTSIDDELASIERSAAGSQRVGSSHLDSYDNGNRVGSRDDFSKHDARQIPNGNRQDTGKAKQRSSLNHLAMKEFLGSIEDYGESENKREPKSKEPKEPARQKPVKIPNPKATGGPEHRPLVGGFAAAAYEASRADHYKKQGKSIQSKPVSRKSQRYPGYP